jgi:hypothetical protein
LRVQLQEMFQSHGEMLSWYSASDKDVNAGWSSGVNSGNTEELQECLGEKMTSGKVGTRQGRNFKCSMDSSLGMKASGKPPAL